MNRQNLFLRNLLEDGKGYTCVETGEHFNKQNEIKEAMAKSSTRISKH